MRHRNRMALSVATMCLMCSGVAGERQQISLGFANIETAIAAKRPGDPQHMTSGIVVRIVGKSAERETFAISNEAGIVVVPLRPGEYCFEAYNHKGLRLDLETKQSHCFSIRAGDTLTVGVVATRLESN